jgi:hypothetical protein
MRKYTLVRVLSAAFLVGGLAACVREPSTPAYPSPSISPTIPGSVEVAASATIPGTAASGTADPGTGTRAPGTTRLPSATPTPIVVRPKSARAVIGKAYAFQLYTHCGIDFSVDFDASFWDAVGARPAAIGNPIQKGTMTLLDARRSRFSYDKGSISYTRHAGIKTIPYLCI